MRVIRYLMWALAVCQTNLATAQDDPHWAFEKARIDRIERANGLTADKDYRAAIAIYEAIARECDARFNDPVYCSKHWGPVMTTAIFASDDRTSDYATIRFKQGRDTEGRQAATVSEARSRLRRNDPKLDVPAALALLRRVADAPQATTLDGLAEQIGALRGLGSHTIRSGDWTGGAQLMARALSLAHAYDAANPYLKDRHSSARDVLGDWLGEAWDRKRWADAEAIQRATIEISPEAGWFEQQQLAWFIERQGRDAEAIAIYRAAMREAETRTLNTDNGPIRPQLALASLLARTPAGLAEARTWLRTANARLQRRVASYPVFDDAAQAELKSYLPLYLQTVKVCWGMAAHREGASIGAAPSPGTPGRRTKAVRS